VVEDLHLAWGNRATVLHLVVSVAMAIVTCDKPLALKVRLHPVIKLGTFVASPHNLHKVISEIKV
jgi:hypothetical protein